MLWYAAMAAGGLAFGLIGDSRPFGDDVLMHPFAIYVLAAGCTLLLLRVAAARPVPDMIPERALLLGWLLGLALFLAGNFVASRLLGAFL